MTSLYHEQPTLEARTLGASLIVLGTVEEGPVSLADYSTDPPQVHSHFRLDVEDTLHGRAPGRSVTVRVLGGQVERLRTEWTCEMAEGDRVLLFLAPYCASEREEDTFVPYFRGCYPVSAEGVINLGGRETMTLEGARSFVQAVLLRREQANAALPERESTARDLSEADLNAMLHIEPGGARWATLDGAAESPRAGG
jgi:hypothetical protein